MIFARVVSMANKQRLAGLIWSVILVIAVQVMPNAAIAHSGHQHTAASQHGATSQDVLPASIAVHDQVADVVARPAGQLAASDERDPAPRPSTGCVGGC